MQTSTRKLKTKIKKLLALLEREYDRPRVKKRNPLDVLVQTILSQNNNDENTARAYASLRRRFGSWEEVLAAGEREIAQAISVGGLSNIKAKRIKRALGEIKKRVGKLSLESLEEMPQEDAEKFLVSLHGVGPKTAACVMCFGFRRPALPVDTHVHRVTKRLGLVAEGMSAARAQEILEELVDARDKISFHINIINHGRKICTARNPKCGRCVLLKLCPTGKKIIKNSLR
ncbi:MAG: endonuclease III [Candidatus Micrarchaeota archaeon]